MDAPALPRTIDDLTEWSVFADHLLTIGDPRGEALALELAMSATPTADELTAFHARCPRLPAPDAKLQFGYQLGHVVALAIAPAPAPKMAHVSAPQTPEQGALAHAHDLLSTPAFARLAELQLPFSSLTRELARLLRRLPKTCTHIVLRLGQTVDDLAAALVAEIPPQVDTVTLLYCTPAAAPHFFTGRFAMVELGRVSSRFDLATALDGAPTTQARVSHASNRLHPRVRLGDDSAGFVEPAGSPAYDALARDGRAQPGEPLARVVPRRTLPELQARFGVIPIRSQLARTLPDHQFVVFDDHAAASVELILANARWTARSTEPFSVDQVVIEPKTVAELSDGARVTIGRTTRELVLRDLEARYRARTEP